MTNKRSRTTTSSTESANHCKRPVIFKEGPLVNAVDCKAIFKNDKEKIKRANNLTVTLLRKHLQPKNYLQWTQNCSLFKFHRGYITDSISEFEREFPVAFSILMYKDIEMFERLLRAIYRPQNYYCIHVDAKTRDDIFKAVLAMTECFENVFMASQRIRVKWGKLSVLTPELVCMDDLLRRSTKWKYFINLTGQEFPLKSNFELVKILTAFNGSNDVECDFKGNFSRRWKEAGPPPFKIKPVKGAVHAVLSRAFVEFALHNEKAVEFYNWTTKTKIPDETFFATLNHNPRIGAPGAYTGKKERNKAAKPYIARFKNRGRIPCAGKRVRGVCIIATGDLPLLARSKSLFVNKLHQDFHPYAYDCLEELMANRTRDYYHGRRTFDASYYTKLDFVKNKVG
ncbi:beta-1,3-galactosyl-O-glycosyl-glycoprotein beta-1,6-N-acetylglucosaminyltransferase-like [Dreissena polymorpha]|uniref:beta-1,3-galactosyl-O-glycosyl-glycoprotein beta-1,6-N-acetylglucosaminyltransferase-like n=1 Tax=Dreissena polymorpha TaxID=45954 RepID=UPI002264E73B|nr:beta-1,3-galactosyl-O-glycosyl-glycoprotein beta-1,6-N-acetylglucosaminyltransferase-like [Dreissena polymorpha]